MSQEVKKKKYKKVVKKDQSQLEQSAIQGSFISHKISDLDLSSIKSQSKVLESRSVQSSLIAEKSIIDFKKKEIINLHHDANYADLKGQFQDGDYLKNLKKYIKKAFNAKNIQLFSCKKAPTLKFQYVDSSRDGEVRIKSLSDLLKANKQLGEKEFETISQIFDQIYCRIGEKDQKVVLFLQKLAQKKRIQLTIVKNKYSKPMLYYQYDEKIINFTLFDIEMRMLEFNSRIIDELKFEEKEFKIWVNFIKDIERKRPQQQKQRQFDEMGQFEVQSDEEYHKVSPSDIKQIKRRLDQLIRTNLTQDKDELQDLEAQQNALLQRNNDDEKPKLQRVADQVCQLHNNITNFQDAVNFVKGKLKDNPSPVQLKNLLKTLIIAKKQLRSNLPITSRKLQIFRLLDKNDLIILEGQTGSGKSTQLPQMMCQYLHMFDEGNKVLPVLITQPRRLATRTVAERVAYEMEEKIGDFVDYATSAHKKVAPSAKIVFKLDSIVLDELTVDRELSKYSCLIIDEAHERTISIDVILGLIKELHKVRKGFKVIVTSASLDGKLFEEYFKTKVFKVSGRLFPVDIIYAPLNHETDMVKKIEKIIKKDILVSNSQIKEQYKGDVLVFCTGVDDINFLCSIFENYLNPRVFRVFPLHGKIAVGQQKQVFYQTKEHKIIFATRIAQTSITINGVKVVIDPGVDRELVYDQKYRVSSRKLINISQSSAKQRAGRAGRTSSGYCFRLYSSKQFDHFRINKTPEIDNMALDTLVLRLKSLRVDNIYSFPYVKVPDKKALEQSVQTLQMIGGLTQGEDITTIGRLLLKLQVQPFLGRSIVEAIICQHIVRNTKFISSESHFDKWPSGDVEYLRNVKTYVIEILCMVISSSNLFYGNINLRDRIQMIKYEKFSNSKGDFNYLSNIYSQFFSRLKRDKQSLEHWFRSNYLTKKTLFQVKQLIEEIQQIIKNFTLDTRDPAIIYLIDTIKVKLKYCKNLDDAILACMVTSFSVNLALYSNNPKVGYTLVLQRKPISIYGTSTLSQQGLCPKWIVCYDLKTNDKGITYCTIAHQVSFEFLKLTVENYVYKRLNLKQAEKMNPFYEQIQRPLPSAVLAQIKKDYMAHDSHTYPLLHHITLDFSESNNTLIVFYSKQLKPADISKQFAEWGLGVYELVDNYILEKVLAKKNGKFISNVVSNIFAQFSDGYIVKQINFADIEVQFLVKGDRYALGAVKSSLDGIHAYPFGQMLKIITFGEPDADRVRQILDHYGLSYDSQKIQKKEQTLNGLIYMRFYTGRLKGQPLFLYYGGKKGQEICRSQHAILQEFQAKEKKGPENCPPQIKKHIKILCQCKFKIGFKANGIKCYHTDVDAFELRQAFQNLMITGILPFNFQKPYSIREFRQQSSTSVQIRSEKQWEDEIQRVFVKHNLNNLSVKVKGQKKDDNDPQLNNAQRMVNKQLTAVISSKSLQTIDDMVKLLDNKPGVIGLGKIHFRHNYKQLIAKVNKRTFKVLMDEYNHIKKLYECQSNVKIQSYEKRFGKIVSVFITCRSPIRENLLYPTEQIKALFYPFIKRLTVAQYKFLYNTDQGNDQLQRIQQEFNYKVYFGFMKRTSQLKIYCLEHEYDKVQKMIDDIFERNPVLVENISYRGKGLSKVQEILQKVIKQNEEALRINRKSKLVLYYTINFKFRQVQVFGDIKSVEIIKDRISKLDQIKLGSCGLCGKNVEQPFKLSYCEHEFCQKCLGDYINQTRKDDDRSIVSINTSTTSTTSQGFDESIPLVCPHEKCNKKINAADLEILLSTEQFENLGMQRLKQFVSGHKQYIFCPTSGCQQIFELSKIEKGVSFECVMCGRWFCSKCRQPHQYFSCTQWTQKLRTGQLMRFGYKKCKCGYVIQKENKDKLVRCKSCRQYMCWNCTKSWKVEKHCLQHIQTCKL